MKRNGFLTAALAAIVAVMPTPAHADEVVNFPTSHAMSNVTTITVQGERQSDGSCLFPALTEALDVAEHAVAVHQKTLNVDTCEATADRGTPSSSEIADATSDAGMLEAVSFSGSSGAPTAGTVQESAGFMRSHHEDILAVEMTAVKSTTDWAWDGDCVQDYVNGSLYGWNATLGWRKSTTTPYSDGSCAVTTSGTDAHFTNSTVCLRTGSIRYGPNEVRGYHDGTLEGSVAPYANGRCSQHYSFHFILVRTK